MDQLLYFFSGLRWQDGLDILLNAYILFRLYVLFRGTQVFRVLVAVCLLWVFNRTALSLGLVVTNWAMQGVITVAVFIVIIIFRNEIANVIQTNDLKSFLWGLPKYRSDTPVSTIVEGIISLAQNKIGALVVLPLQQGLESVVQAGIELDAVLSQETLISLFWPDNPLHDGAAIIMGDRIVSAGVILPLSGRKDLPSHYGTRHRAALGLSQLTDALMIVVSEERGTITLCKEGHGIRVKNRMELEKNLKEHMGEESGEKGLHRQNLELAVAAMVCLLSVSGIWLSFSRGLESLASYEIPIEFQNPEPKKEILSSSASKVNVLVSGASPLINALKPEQITASIDLSQAAVGESTLQVTADLVRLPPGIVLKKVEPSSVTISLDNLEAKEMPVQANWTGKLPPGLIMTQAQVEPGTVKVLGGSLVLQEMATLFTEAILLDNLTRSGKMTVGIALSPASLEAATAKVQVRFTLEKKEN